MQMLYNSDSFAVVRIDIEEAVAPALSRGGYEIVDKFARKEIFIQGALAERFKNEVQALVERDPSEEEMDALIAGFAGVMAQPLVLH
ncbi:MAG: DUF3567 domain-containing protein [Piscinibacter sp.]|uniref:BTH_I0359 family protein n=1 Tax=Piscinibacter TaxID=1114981 RepID=UPI000FDF4461|nr:MULTISPECIES: DUF3567 domain-containing protein [Piscinibacter]MCW5667877.1 DUF3567 domain-containing protein [Piscinibacter sp.]